MIKGSNKKEQIGNIKQRDGNSSKKKNAKSKTL